MNTIMLLENDVTAIPVRLDSIITKKIAAILMALALLIYCATPALACYTQTQIQAAYDAAQTAAQQLAEAAAASAAAQATAEVLLEAAVVAEATGVGAPIAAALLAAAIAAEAFADGLAAILPGLAFIAAQTLATYQVEAANPCCSLPQS
jgi:hypothetical protein